MSGCHANESGCSSYNGAETVPYALAVDQSGNLTVAGSTSAANFPTTANVYTGGFGAFVCRISADGSQLIWSTQLGVPMPMDVLGSALISIPFPVNSIALDAANNVYLTGHTWQPIATTPGALQSQSQLGQTLGNDFVVKLSSDATQLLFATNLTATVSGVTLDAAGNAWVTGNTIYSTSDGKVNATNFPGLANVPPGGLDFALELNSDASALQQIFSFLPPTATQPPVFDSSGDLLLLASAGNLVRLNASTALSASAVFAIANSAVPQAAAVVAPGELLTLYGVGLGPATAVVGRPNQNGLYPAQLGGVSVKVSGVAAPLLYAGPDQINLQVPFLPPYNTGPAPIVVTTQAGPLLILQPPIFGSVGIFAVVNEDGSVNSASNPAADGSIVSLYLTGLGAPSPSAQAGAISQTADSAFLTASRCYGLLHRLESCMPGPRPA
jgi:uncharacterized protein (TIGR03437 family)